MRVVRLEEALDMSKLAEIIASQRLDLFARSILMLAIYYQWHTVTSLNRYILRSADEDSPTHLFGCELSAPTPVVYRKQWRDAASGAIACICNNTEGWRESKASQLAKLHHYISILLTVPLQPMCDYIGWMGTKSCIDKARESLCSWIAGDTENSRRTVMHAIALLCLVRRQKSGSYSENHYVFVAFLVIWAFFSLDPVARPRGDVSIDETPCDAPMCEIDWDNLDALETWITAPGHPPLRLAGVGTLGDTSGLRQILVETLRILLSDRTWVINGVFAAVLEGLISRGTTAGDA